MTLLDRRDVRPSTEHARTGDPAVTLLDRRLWMHPRVALRPEPFGALAYHYDTRRLVFLKHPDVVRVVGALGEHESLAATLAACGIEPRRWPAFERALTALLDSEMLLADDLEAADAR